MIDWKHPWESKTLICNLLLALLPFVYPPAYQVLHRLPPETLVQVLSLGLCGLNVVLRHFSQSKISWQLGQ